MAKSTSSTKNSTKCTSNHSTKEPRLNHDTRAQIPSGPSNIDTYISREETWEHIAMGHVTYGDQAATERALAKKLAEWEARWGPMDGR